jgi:hypothetical protein
MDIAFREGGDSKQQYGRDQSEHTEIGLKKVNVLQKYKKTQSVASPARQFSICSVYSLGKKWPTKKETRR